MKAKMSFTTDLHPLRRHRVEKPGVAYNPTHAAMF